LNREDMKQDTVAVKLLEGLTGGIMAISVRDRGGTYVCETSRFPLFLYNRFIYGGEVFSLTRRPPITKERS
jgi:hypothetical protein